MNQLVLHFSCTECNGWPKLKFFIDDDLYHDYEFNSTIASVEIPLELLTGQHQLEIEFYGKTQNNTIQINNCIVKDQLVTLDSLTIDNITVPDFIKYRGLYRVGNTERPQILTWGENGTWMLQFEYPIIDWILNLKMQATLSHIDDAQWATSVFHPKKIQTLKETLKVLEKILTDVDT